MTDIFKKEDLHDLLRCKKVVFIGDSNIRAYYKDLLCLYCNTEIGHQRLFKSKMENTVYNDMLVSHGKKMNGRDYREERRFRSKNYCFEFYFITRVFDDYVKEVLDKAKHGGEPDAIILNSCLWDMCRWGPDGVRHYKQNVVRLMDYLNNKISKNCLVIWVTTPPISSNIRGGFLVVQLDFLKYCLRFHVMEANTYCKKIVVAHGYDVLDIHYHLRMQLHRRSSDGIHWLPTAIRYVTNLLLTHISLSWSVSLPHRYESLVTQRAIAEADRMENDKEMSIPSYKESKQEKKNHGKENKKPSTVRPSYHDFEKKQRLKQSHRRIRGWAKERPYSQTDEPPAHWAHHQDSHRKIRKGFS